MFMISKSKQLPRNISRDKLDGPEGLAITILTMYNGGRKAEKFQYNFIYPPNSYHGKSRNQMSFHIRFILTLNKNVTSC